MNQKLTKSIVFLLILCSQVEAGFCQKSKSEFYEIKIYYLRDSSQAKRVDAFLKGTYLPALHEAGIKNVGVFKPVETDTTAGKRVFVLIPYRSLEEFSSLTDLVTSPKKNTDSNYADALYSSPPYSRIESILLRAFSGMPKMEVPILTGTKTEKVYELRSYESATEKIHKNKMQMFNEGDEIGLFKRLEFHSVFYADVISGSHMPNLMYMTAHASSAAREENWKKFRIDPQWVKLKALPEYQNNVSKINIFLLHPAEYSDY